MAWTLKIHHIDVVGSGDATLIEAEDPTVAGARRTMLIDGGRIAHANNLHQHLTTVGNVTAASPLNIVAVTHYDVDHMGGIFSLFNQGHVEYANVRVYDQGEPLADNNPYLRYLSALRQAPNRRRVTGNVMSEWLRPGPFRTRAGVQLAPPQLPPGMVMTSQPVRLIAGLPMQGMPALQPQVAPGVPLPAAQVNDWWCPHWLVGREVLWATDTGDLGVVPAGAPTVHCIAANRYVRNPAGGATYLAAGLGIATVQNEKSLAFEVRFGNFRYYIGGDIETAQETMIAANLNPTNDVAGRVQVVKASHHGAATASAPGFIARMRPDAVMISNGQNNQYGHPLPPTVATLDGLVGVVPTRRRIWHYLTGYDVPFGAAPQTAGGVNSRTGGNPPANTAGDILVRVTATQANAPAIGSAGTALTGAITATSTISGVAAPPGTAAAAIEALYSAPHPTTAAQDVVTVVLTGLGLAGPAATAVAAAAVPAAVAAAVAAPGAHVDAFVAAMRAAVMAQPGITQSQVFAAAATAAVAWYGFCRIGSGASIDPTMLARILSKAVNIDVHAAIVAAAAAMTPGATGMFTVFYDNLNAQTTTITHF
ncbi:ComEC/Rec2 family competence protein [Actinoplanes couchii]|uniref:Metallo-beta-lactamase domain-containing protein n=1 Tax=Actinoplanes couchii TaxID=403638 RepID=A0ABQ3X8F3_9ACTN|nr:hypothetical protein [Actinoplanes couchii]MDR6320209.1 beta-lactamase superfamily II metal-dependent hydrolase [Actinoplanes couchii]GID54776.1 hypothetical protein Aco03nite_031800 [Actinoplanes couchii]